LAAHLFHHSIIVFWFPLAIPPTRPLRDITNHFSIVDLPLQPINYARIVTVRAAILWKSINQCSYWQTHRLSNNYGFASP